MGAKGSKGKKEDKKKSPSPAPAGPVELKFTDRFQAVHKWAEKNGFVSAFPTFQMHKDDDGNSIYGVVLIKEGCAEIKDLSPEDLENAGGPAARIRAAHNYAVANGYSGGFLTFCDKEGTHNVCLLNEATAEVVLVEPGTIGQKAEQRFSDAHKWAIAEEGRGVSAYNNFKTQEVEEGEKHFELVVLKADTAEHRDIPLAQLTA